MHICNHIYMCVEREREITCIHIYIYIYILGESPKVEVQKQTGSIEGPGFYRRKGFLKKVL